jgi:uncharacterized protein
VTTSPVSGLPPTAAWRHLDPRDGFEVLFPRREPDGYRFSGYATAVEAGAAWGVRYVITVDTDWAVRQVRRFVLDYPGIAERIV